jgi:hypothetical protein
VLGYPRARGANGPPGAVAINVARHIQYGTAAAPIVFPAQLTGLPAASRISFVYFLPYRGVLRASQYTLAASAGHGQTVSYTTNPATAGGSCYFYGGGQSARQVVAGYQVTVNHLAAVRGNPPAQQLCAAHADGLSVFISETGHPAQGVVSLFARHLRLLGPDPANWTPAPIG